MAYIPQQQGQEEDDKFNKPSSGGTLSAGAAGAAPTQNKKQNFATLQSYLKAGKPQGEQFASKLASDLSQTGQQAQQGIEQAGQKLTSDVQGQTLNYNPNTVTSAFENPTEFVKSPERVGEFTKYRTASYGGPGSAEETQEFQQAQANTAKALERSRLADTEAGRKQLAAESQKSKAGGITALNQAFLSTNPNAAATLQGAKGSFANLQDMLSGKAVDVNARIKAAKEAAERARTDVATGLTPLPAELEKQLAEQTQKALEARDARNKAIIDQKQWLDPLQSLIAGYNATKDYGDPLADFKKNFTGEVRTDVPTRAETATKEQYEREAALEKLTGQPLSILQNEDVSKVVDRSQYYDQSKVDSILNEIYAGDNTPETRQRLQEEADKPKQPGTNPIAYDDAAQANVKQTVTNQYLRPALLDEAKRIAGREWTPAQDDYYKDKSADEILRSMTDVWINGEPGVNRMSPEFRNLLTQMEANGMVKNVGDSHFPKYRTVY